MKVTLELNMELALLCILIYIYVFLHQGGIAAKAAYWTAKEIKGNSAVFVIFRLMTK